MSRFLQCVRALVAAMSIGALTGDLVAEEVAVTFEHDIQPLLTRFGCNSGACHGKSRGQNGFALSLLGFDSDFDYASITREGRGRRISSSAPASSLLLEKATGRLPHGGGARFAVGSKQFRLLVRWLEGGYPRTPADAPKLVRVVVEPPTKSLVAGQSTDLQVFAEYSDGSRRDVTESAAYQSNDRTIASVTDDGLVKAGPVPGETAVLARYMNNIAVCHIALPIPGNVSDDTYANLPTNNEIDQLVWKKLKVLGMLPSGVAGDSKFIRRAYLRVIGRLPKPAEVRAFLADSSSDKRSRLVDKLLQRPEYGDFWANKWADLLRPNPYRVGIKAVWTLDAYLRKSFRKNVPYDQFARELVTAKGSTWKNGATVIHRDRPLTVEIGSSVSQLFLGVRLECAKCHHHPFEVWSQDDFFGFAAFFARVGHNGGLSPPISGGEELIYTKPSGSLRHGRTGANVLPQVLLGNPLTIGPDKDPREVLADWMTSPENPFFAKVMANRVWAEIMGRGLVEPVDDIRATNPSTNEELLEFLAEDFRSYDYDVKHLIATIMKSHVFELSSTPVSRNVGDQRNFARAYRHRMGAEVLLDAVNDILETEETFAAMPPGSRATQLWTYRSSSLFLDTFGRPDPNQDPPCERSSDSTTPQILHLMNSPALNKKLANDSGRVARLAASDMANAEIIDEAYLLMFSRRPTAEESKKAAASLPSKDRRLSVEDLFWALLNTPEFSFID
ncbi:MAG: S-layer protein [Planctomycetaceae bacterium]|nr:MAG: S-layer protein [Planctomycetaceae bacterium]